MREPPGWPKKETDSIPNITIKGEGYYWVKLPSSDKRALILGKITDCCQSMGGESEQCVKDAVSLDDNGLYVLLKQRSGKQDTAPMINGEINYKNFQIIGQSYVWKSKLGDICLDSIECLKNSIPDDVLKRTLTGFGTRVMVEDPSIRRVTIGRGGKTPEHLFPATGVPVEIKQGFMYGDAIYQFVIAQSPELAITQNPELNEFWKIATEKSVEKDAHSIIEKLEPDERMAVLDAKDTDGRSLVEAAFSGLMLLKGRDILNLCVDDDQRIEIV